MSVYAAQIAGLLDTIGVVRAHIVGFSIGGMINRRFALDYPGRVASLVILNSPHDRGEAAQAQVEARAATVRDQGMMATLPDALIRWFTPQHRATGTGPARVTAWRAQVDAESYAQAAWVLAHGVRELIAPDPAVKAPTLVMTCAHDTGSTPAMSHAIGAEIAGSTVQIVPRLQHLGLMENPDAFTGPICDFLHRIAP
ncbi:MAG: alpha/beta fold hydrolase [Primorskyibacter sp.]